MKNTRTIPLVLAFFTANIAFGADEIHWTITGQNSVTFDWRGTDLEKSIGYGLSPGAYTQLEGHKPNPVPTSSKGPFWEAKLTGLKENSLYYYSIGNGPERTFLTPPPKGSSNFTIYAQGDIGDTGNYFNVGTIQQLITDGKPAFVIGLGDLSLGSKNGKAAVDQHFNDVMTWSKEAAYMPVWGDLDWHRSKFDGFNNYKGRFDVPNPQTSLGSPLAGGEDWYWFDYGNARFITLPEPLSGAWAAWKTKADVLMTEAQADPAIKYIVTLVHQPAYSSGHHHGSPLLRSILNKLGDTYNKYVLNLNADSVNYERSHPQHGIVHVTAGIGGSDLQQDGHCLWLTCKKPAWSAFRAMHHGALKLHFTDSAIEGSFICGPKGGGKNDINCVQGNTVDNFVIQAVAAGSSAARATTRALSKAATCTQTALDVSGITSDTGYSYLMPRTFGIPADTSTYPSQSALRLFENGVELSPPHSKHADIRTYGLGRFSHSLTSTGIETLRFSASDNTNPKTNGKSYSYCTSTDTQAPTVPGAFSATAGSSSQIGLSWTASSDNVGVTGYRVSRNGVQIGTTASTTYTDSGLSPATGYTYSVVAVDAAGNASGPASATATTSAALDIQAPTVPGAFSATVGSSTQIGLSWTASSDNVGVTGYRVSRNGVQIGTTASTTYTDSGLSPATGYTYSVVAVDAAGNASGPASATATTSAAPDTQAPTVPGAFSATAGSSTQIGLSWTASSDNVGVTGYRVSRNGVQIGTTASTTYTDSGLSPATGYTYSVVAVDAAGNASGPASATATTAAAAASTADVQAPTVPGTFNAKANSQTQIGLSWTASSDNVGVTGYKVSRNGVQIGITTSTSYVDPDRSPATSYTYSVVAIDAAGNASSPASGTGTTSPANATGTCTSVTPLNVSAAASDTGYSYIIKQTFGVPADTSTFPKQSVLRVFENGVELSPPHAIHSSIRTYGQGRFSHSATSTGVEALRFSASDNSNPKTNGKTYVYCTTNTTDVQAPSVPGSFNATAGSSTQVNLAWTVSSDNIGVTGYKVFRNGVQIGTTTSTTYKDTGLSAGTSYTYSVSAIDAIGNLSIPAVGIVNTGTTAASCAPAPTSTLVVNVKDKGATGNGSTNDTAAIQAAINQVAGTGGTVLIPDGTYMIDAVTRLNAKSNITIRLSSNAVLKAIPNNQANYGIIRIENVSNVNVIGGKLQGERTQHQSTTGEWGMGVEIYTANNVVVEGVTATDMWGDGYYIGRNSANVYYVLGYCRQ